MHAGTSKYAAHPGKYAYLYHHDTFSFISEGIYLICEYYLIFLPITEEKQFSKRSVVNKKTLGFEPNTKKKDLAPIPISGMFEKGF